MKKLLKLLIVSVNFLIVSNTANGQIDTSIINAITRTYEDLKVCEINRDSLKKTIKDLDTVIFYKDSVINLKDSIISAYITQQKVEGVTEKQTKEKLKKSQKDNKKLTRNFYIVLGIVAIETIILIIK